MVGDFGFEFGSGGLGALRLLGGIVEVEAEEGSGWWVGEVISWGGVGYLAGDAPAVEF